MNALLYRNINIGTSLPAGVHIYNRYSVDRAYRYSYSMSGGNGSFTHPNNQGGTRTYYVFSSSQFSFNQNTGAFTINDYTTAYVSTGSFSNVEDSLYQIQGMYFAGTSRPTTEPSSTCTAISLISTGYSHSGSTFTLTFTKSKTSSTLISENRGIYVDTITVKDDISDGVNTDGYWYERIQ